MGLVTYDQDMIIKILVILTLTVIAIILYNYWTTGKFFFAPPVEEKINVPKLTKKDDEFLKNISEKKEDIPELEEVIPEKDTSVSTDETQNEDEEPKIF